MTGCLIMFVEDVSRNVWSKYTQELWPWLQKGRQASTRDFHILYLAKETLKTVSFSRSYQIHSIFCRSKYQTLLPPHFCPYAFSQFFLALPHFPILSPPPAPACSLCVYSPEVAAAHADASQWINGGTVSLGTWKEPGSPFFPTPLFVVWPDWLMKEFCSSYDT